MRDAELGVERTGVEDADRVVVGEHEVADRLVGVLAQPSEPGSRGDGRRQRFEAEDEVLALVRPQVGVALCGEGVDAIGQHLQGLRFRGGVGGGRERLACNEAPFVEGRRWECFVRRAATDGPRDGAQS